VIEEVMGNGGGNDGERRCGEVVVAPLRPRAVGRAGRAEKNGRRSERGDGGQGLERWAKLEDDARFYRSRTLAKSMISLNQMLNSLETVAKIDTHG
jgi:hypothetical protein